MIGSLWTDKYVLPLSLHGPPTQYATFANAQQLRGVRAVAPVSGTIGGLWYQINAIGTGGQICGAIYRTDKTTLLRTKLWQGSWAAAVASANWQTFGNPNLAVNEGDWLELCAAGDANQPTWMRMQTWQSITVPPAPFIQMPPTPEWQNLGDNNNRPADASGLIGGDFMSWHVFGNGMAAGSTLPASLTIDKLTWASPPVFLVASYA